MLYKILQFLKMMIFCKFNGTKITFCGILQMKIQMNFTSINKVLLLKIFKKSHICQMMHRKPALICLLLFNLTINLYAQNSNYDKYAFTNRIFNIQFLVNQQSSGGDMSKSFGNHNSIGFGGLYKTKNNWLLSAEGNYLFGNSIKDLDILNNLVNGSGYISNNNGSPANYSVNMRGYSLFAKGGRIFSLSKTKKNSGIIVQAGFGFLQYKINFQTQNNDVPQLNEEYFKGYDRLTNGIAFNQFLGYYYHSPNRLINFYAGFDFTQANTKNRRGYLYDKKEFDSANKKDFIYAFRIGWMIPIYLHAKNEDEFNFR
jgi:hypothetical protein